MALQIEGQATALEQSVTVPLFLERIHAGFPSPADDFLEGHLSLDDYCINKPAATFFLRASGDSMIDAGIFPEDLLVVDRSIRPKNGDIVIAVVDGDLTVKRLIRKGKRLYLWPENEQYRPILIRKDQELHVWGVVTYVIHGVHQ